METIHVVIQAKDTPVSRDLEKRIQEAIEGFARQGAEVRLSRVLGFERESRGIAVRVGRRVRILDPSAILHAQSEDDHCVVSTSEGELVVRTSLANLEAILDPGRWIRVHRRHLVRVDQVEGWRVLEGGGLVIRLRSPSRDVPVSRSRRCAVRHLWGGTLAAG